MIKKVITKKLKKDKRYILVSHTPPYKILDYSMRFSDGKRDDNIGSTSIKDVISTGLVDLIICGHSHLNGGKSEKHKNTIVINIASQDTDGRDPGNFCIVELENGSINYEFYNTYSTFSEHPLAKLQQVGGRRLKHMKKEGIVSLEDIKEENREKLKRCPGVADWHINRWIEQRKSIEEGKPLIKDKELKTIIGENYILYDIETGAQDNANLFLISTYNSKTKKSYQFFQKKNTKALLNDFEEYLSQYPNFNLVSFSNSNFEKRNILTCAEKFKMKQLALMIKKERNIGTSITEIIIGDYQYNLKALASRLGYKWKSKLNGFEVGIQYDRYLKGKETPNWKAIKEYNKEDVLALKFVIDTIVRSK